jgi:hypothetical protein
MGKCNQVLGCNEPEVSENDKQSRLVTALISIRPLLTNRPRRMPKRMKIRYPRWMYQKPILPKPAASDSR